MSNTPLITVITSTYNAGQYLEESLLSVLNQSYTNIELIIIDGNSSDNTVNIIKKYEDKIAYWVSEDDSGIYNAWNKGIEKVTGDWVMFLGADDFIWNDKVFETIIPHLNTSVSKNTNYVYGTVNRITENKEFIEKRGVDWEIAKATFYNGMKFTHSGSFHHKSLFEKYGDFDESFRISGDYEFLVRCFKNGENAFYAEEVETIGMRMGGISNHPSTKLKMAKELKKAIKKHKLKHNNLLHFMWVIKLRLKQLL